MTASTLPRIAAMLPTAKAPLYAAVLRSGFGDGRTVTSWLPGPTMSAGEALVYRWADDADVTEPHVTLSVSVMAELLFLSDLEPLELSDAAALVAIDRSLCACGCDVTRAAAEVGGEIAEHPECAGPRLARCVVRAARMVGTEA